MSEQEYREFWIDIEINNPKISVTNVWKTHCLEAVHVIEFSAYQAAQDKIQQLEKQNKIMREALDEIERCWDISDLSCVRPVVESRMTIGSYTKEIRNDSIASASIAKAIKALKKAEEV